jgi:hypothetical protein
MGSGRLMADFITLEKLVLKGFKNISIDFVEPEGIDPDKMMAIQKFFEDMPDFKLKMGAYKSIDEITQESNYSAITAIDYSGLACYFDAAKDLFKSLQRLKSTGFIVLGCSLDAAIFDPNMNLLKHFSEDSLTNNLISDLTENLPKQAHLSLGISSIHAYQEYFLFCLASSLKNSGNNYSKISIHLPKEHSNSDNPINSERMQSFFPSALVEIHDHLDSFKPDIFLEASQSQHLDNSLSYSHYYASVHELRFIRENLTKGTKRL